MSPFPGHHLSETTWRRSAAVAFAVLTIVFAGLLYRAEHKAEQQTHRVEAHVTKIESPCQRYSEQKTAHNKLLCEEAFEKAVLTITHPEACAILRKAGLEITECAHARLRQEHGRRKERAATQRSKEVMPSTPQTGHSQTGPREGGHGTRGSHPTHHAVTPPAPSPAPSPPAEGSTTESRLPEQAKANPVAEGAGHAVEETGATVNEAGKGAVEDVQHTGCALAHSC